VEELCRRNTYLLERAIEIAFDLVHHPYYKGCHNQDNSAGTKLIVEVPRGDQFVIDVSDIELHEFTVLVLEDGATVIWQHRRRIKSPKLEFEAYGCQMC
jgi:hypothetical protein